MTSLLFHLILPLPSPISPCLPYFSLSCPFCPSPQRMLRKVAKEKVQRKSLDGSITQSMMAWQQRRSVQDNNDAMRAFTKAKGESIYHGLSLYINDRLSLSLTDSISLIDSISH